MSVYGGWKRLARTTVEPWPAGGSGRTCRKPVLHLTRSPLTGPLRVPSVSSKSSPLVNGREAEIACGRSSPDMGQIAVLTGDIYAREICRDAQLYLSNLQQLGRLKYTLERWVNEPNRALQSYRSNLKSSIRVPQGEVQLWNSRSCSR